MSDIDKADDTAAGDADKAQQLTVDYEQQIDQRLAERQDEAIQAENAAEGTPEFLPGNAGNL